MRTSILSRKLKRNIVQMLTLLVLVLYVAGTSPLEIIPVFAHDHEALAAHSDEQEKDPCHRLIYHNDTEQGCAHNSHWIATDECPMCDLEYNGEKALLSTSAFESKNISQVEFATYKESLDNHQAVISSSRAPPALI